LLAYLQLKAGNAAEAERLYELGHRDDPFHSRWIAGLARVHLLQKDGAKLLGDLAMLAANDSDDLDVRNALAERHLEPGRPEEAAKWANECLYIDVYDPANHVVLADALAARKSFEDAVEEYQTALELKAKKPNDLKVRLARAQLGLGRRDDARATLDGV